MSPSRIERRTLIIGVLVAVVIVVVGLSAAVAGAEQSARVVSVQVGSTPTTISIVTTVASIPATGAYVATSSALSTNVPGAKGAYALDFTLPTFGKSGCLVCHGDPNLVLAKGDTTHSYFIDEAAYAQSAHGKIACTGCHVDYGYNTPHGQAGDDWRAVAKQACKNCHQAEFHDWSLGAHAVNPVGVGQPDPNAAAKPLCGDCHGSHDMPVLKNNPAGQAEVYAQAQQMCGKPGCHPDYWANFNDYYHGAAYKKGATDAPVCWTCHGTHMILKSSDPNAPTNVANLGRNDSCGTPGCHQDAGPAYASYAPMIHGRDKVASANPVVEFFTTVLGRR
jgi:hypothetical protein